MAVTPKIKLPHEAVGTFIRAANSWLTRTVDAKTSLEVRFANQNGKLHLSAGADSNYIEAIVTVDPADIDNLTQPIFLDIPSLAAYDFDSDGLTMLVPQVERADQKIAFSAPGLSLRIPRKKGDIWSRNAFDLAKLQETDVRLPLSKEVFEKLWKNLSLPNSYKTKRENFQFAFEIDPGQGFIVYSYDGLTSFCHTFKDDKIQGTQGRMVLLEDFFKPCKEFKVESEIVFAVAGSQCVGCFESPTIGIESLRWTQPLYGKKLPEVPAAIEKQRQHSVAVLQVNVKDLSTRLAQACMLLTPAEMTGIPTDLSVVGDQYALSTRKPSGEGEVRAEGKLEESCDVEVEISLHSAGLKDFLAEFDSKSSLNIEVLKSTVVMYQELEGRTILYWVPIVPRAGSN